MLFWNVNCLFIYLFLRILLGIIDPMRMGCDTCSSEEQSAQKGRDFRVCLIFKKIEKKSRRQKFEATRFGSCFLKQYLRIIFENRDNTKIDIL